jgi:hypothetical protein
VVYTNAVWANKKAIPRYRRGGCMRASPPPENGHASFSH